MPPRSRHRPLVGILYTRILKPFLFVRPPARRSGLKEVMSGKRSHFEYNADRFRPNFRRQLFAGAFLTGNRESIWFSKIRRQSDMDRIRGRRTTARFSRHVRDAPVSHHTPSFAIPRLIRKRIASGAGCPPAISNTERNNNGKRGSFEPVE